MYTLDINELECRRLSQAVGVGPDELISTFFFEQQIILMAAGWLGGVSTPIFFLFLLSI